HYKERFGDAFLLEYDTAVFAASPKGYAVNLMVAMETIINRTGKRLLASLKLKEILKRKWRSGLAEKAVSAGEREVEVEGSQPVENPTKKSGPAVPRTQDAVDIA